MNYQKELEKFSVFKEDYPKYENPEEFSRKFQQCSVYKYENVSYSNNSQVNTMVVEKVNA